MARGDRREEILRDDRDRWKSRSALTIEIHLLDPGVDRSVAELEGCRLESWSGLGFQSGHQVVGSKF